MDIYRVIATASCNLQAVEQFPWEVVAKLETVISTLNVMSISLRLVQEDSNDNLAATTDELEIDINY